MSRRVCGFASIRSAPSPGDPAGGGDEEQPAWTRRLPTLEGSATTLRELELSDVPALFDALESSDIEVAFEPAPSTPR